MGLDVAAAEPEPSTAETVQEVEFATVAPDDDKATELMKTACSGAVEQLRAEDSGAPVPVCRSCPASASNPDGELRLEGGYIGDFSGDGNADAVLATMGCGQTFNSRHSTVVLSRTGDSWTNLEYLDFTNSSDCDHIETGDRDWLLCRSTTVGQGASETFVYLRHLTDTGLDSNSLVELHDNSAACSFEGEFRKVIAERVVDDFTGDGTDELALGLRTDNGSVPDGVEEVEDRCDEDSYDISEHRSLMVFSLEAAGPEHIERLESSLEHSDLQEYVSYSDGSEQEDDEDTDDDNVEVEVDVEGDPFKGGGF